VFLCVREDGGKWVPDEESPDHFTSVGGLLNLTRMFSLALDQLREFEDSDTEEALRRFEHYVGEQRQRFLARYHEYFRRARRAAERAGERGRPEEIPEEMDPDAQVFFGRLMLTRRHVPPEEAGMVASICGLVCGCFKALMFHNRERNPALAESLGRAFVTLRDLLYYCDQALVQGRPLLFLA
jgi:hypothetical protein